MAHNDQLLRVETWQAEANKHTLFDCAANLFGGRVGQAVWSLS